MNFHIHNCRLEMAFVSSISIAPYYETPSIHDFDLLVCVCVCVAIEFCREMLVAKYTHMQRCCLHGVRMRMRYSIDFSQFHLMERKFAVLFSSTEQTECENFSLHKEIFQILLNFNLKVKLFGEFNKKNCGNLFVSRYSFGISIF